MNEVFIPARIKRELRSIYTNRVTVISAPDGTGKSTLLREFTARTRPKNAAIRFITSANSARDLFSQIAELITGKAYSEPISTREYNSLSAEFANARPEKPLLIIADCPHTAECLLENIRTAKLLAHCECARTVFVCNTLKPYHRILAKEMHFGMIERSQLAMTPDETEEYARISGVNDPDIQKIYDSCSGSFLGTRLFFMLEQQSGEQRGLTTEGMLLKAVLEKLPVKAHGALIAASAFPVLSAELCSDLSSFRSIKDFFGAETFTVESIMTETAAIKSRIPLLESDRRRRSFRFHPSLSRAVYTLFFWLPEAVRHDVRICFARQYKRLNEDFSAFCEYFLAGEFELASEIHPHDQITYDMLMRSRQRLQGFIRDCPLGCKPALPRVLRINALLMHTDLNPALRDRFTEIISFINSSPDYSPAERRSMLCYAYALRTNEDFYDMDKMGISIKRAYDLFRDKREHDAPMFPWTLYAPTVFFLLHRRGKSLQTENQQFTRYQHMYTEMLNHGRYAELVFTGEMKYCQGELSGALDILSKAASLCTGSERTATRLAAMYCCAKCCLYLGDHERFVKYFGSIREVQRRLAGTEESDCARLIIGLLRTRLGGGIEDQWHALCTDSSGLIYNRYTAPYYAMVAASYLIRSGEYEELASRCTEYLECAAAAGNEEAEITLRLYSAQAFLSLGEYEKAVQLACDALERTQENGIPTIAAEFCAFCPELFTQIKPHITPALTDAADEAERLGGTFRRGVEVVRTYELTYLVRNTADSLAQHYLVPLERLLSSTKDTRMKLGLTETAYSYAIMAASGASNQDISAIMNASENSIKSSLKRTYSALGISNRRELVGKVPTLK